MSGDKARKSPPTRSTPLVPTGSPQQRRPSLPRKRDSSEFQPCAQDRECLISLYRSTHGGGQGWRTSRGWPSLQKGGNMSEDGRRLPPACVKTYNKGGSSGTFIRISPSASAAVTARTTDVDGDQLARRNPCAVDDLAVIATPKKVQAPPGGAAAKSVAPALGESLPCRLTPNNPFNNPSPRQAAAVEVTATQPSLNPFTNGTSELQVLQTSEASSILRDGGKMRCEAGSSSDATPTANTPPERVTTTAICSPVPTGKKDHDTAHDLTDLALLNQTTCVLAADIERRRVEGGGEKSKADTQGGEWYGVSLGADYRVTALKLADNGLAGRLPGDLGGLVMMRYLHVGRNYLTGAVHTLLLRPCRAYIQSYSTSFNG